MGWFKLGDTEPGFSFISPGWLFDIRRLLCSLSRCDEWKAASVIWAVTATWSINIINMHYCVSFGTVCVSEVQTGKCMILNGNLKSM